MPDIINASGTEPLATFAANVLATAQFTDLVSARDLKSRKLARFVIVHGHWASLAGGGSIVVRVTTIPNAVKPSAGAGAGNVLAGKLVWNGADSDSVTVATGAAADGYFSAVFNMNSAANNSGESLPIPAEHVTVRVSNPSTAYSAGTLYIDKIEIVE